MQKGGGLNASTAKYSVQEEQLLETFSEEIRHSDKERTAVAFESRLGLIGKRAESVVIKVVIVANVERLARRRAPTKQ